jgi:hypothetical protein
MTERETLMAKYGEQMVRYELLTAEIQQTKRELADLFNREQKDTSDGERA